MCCRLTLYLTTIAIETMNPTIIRLLTPSAHFLYLSAAQNAPPAGQPPSQWRILCQNKQKKCAEKVIKHI